MRTYLINELTQYHHIAKMKRRGFQFLLLLAAYCLLLTNFANAAPHIAKVKPEPVSRVGTHIKERMKAKKFAPMLANATTGNISILFLRVDFPSDTNSQTTGNGNWTDSTYACNAAGAPDVISGDTDCVNSPNDYWVNKAKDKFIAYFSETSYDALGVQIDISASVYRLPNQMSSYGSESDTALSNLIKDSVQAADADFDFSIYDAVMIIHAGAGEETDTYSNSSSDIWSLYYGSSTTPFVTADGVGIVEAIVMPQTDSQDGEVVDPFGVYAHEFGHWLGLPDLYVTSLMQSWDGIGKWGLMGDGIYNQGTDGIYGSSPAHPDAWCKTYLGWVTPQSISSDFGATSLSAVENGPEIIKLRASSTTSSQYFLLENRQQTGFDVGLPGSGMIVWLIDDDVISANIDLNAVNNSRLRPGVKPIEADGRNDLDTYGGDYGGPGDPFPGTSGNTSFTPNTDPASTPYTGDAWLCLRNIASSGSNINLTIGFAPIPPSNLAAIHDSSTTLTWNSNSESDLASYNIYRNGSLLANTTQNQYIDTASASGDRYSVTALDRSSNESAQSASARVTFVTESSGGSGGGGCFIATAAYGSYEAPYVRILREFRDRYLLSNKLGSYFVKFYYSISPRIADFVRENEILKRAVRILLLPLVGFAAFMVMTTLVQKILISLVCALGLVLFKKVAAGLKPAAI